MTITPHISAGNEAGIPYLFALKEKNDMEGPEGFPSS